jgi:predicted outer membrane protein
MFWGANAALDDHKDSQAYSKDISFIKEAAQGGQAEVQLGKLATEKGQNPQIKELASAWIRTILRPIRS